MQPLQFIKHPRVVIPTCLLISFWLHKVHAFAGKMSFGVLQVYLVGDPVQLPATVISSFATDLNYDCSMFKRLQSAGYPVRVLDVQYRMHPDISKFPSVEFYQGRLKDGEVSGWQEHSACAHQ